MVLTDTHNILKAFDDDNDKKLTEIKNQLVDEFKTELYSFEVRVTCKRRRYYKNG